MKSWMLKEKCALCQWHLQSGSLESMASGQLLEVTGEGELEFDNIQRWAKK